MNNNFKFIVPTRRCPRCRKVFILNNESVRFHQSCKISSSVANWRD